MTVIFCGDLEDSKHPVPTLSQFFICHWFLICQGVTLYKALGIKRRPTPELGPIVNKIEFTIDSLVTVFFSNASSSAVKSNSDTAQVLLASTLK